MKSIQRLLDEFCSLNELPPLLIENNGRCQLLVDDRTLLYFIATEDNELLLSARVGALPKQGSLRNRGLELLARANYYGLGCGGLNLAISPDGRQVILFGRKALEMLDAANLTQWFDEFNQQSSEWSARFSMLDRDIPLSESNQQTFAQQLRV
ncbi:MULTISPECIES: type III secretion system chaperone [Vibrio]|uniref:Type III secretion chaperone CesT n=1 Tax=Vibrio bivalvicida TaxID=1276888 RepID=A0A177XTY8_9VIBR|nr:MULTISPECIES: type III secretion system chaperone [Vibrio]KLN64715.1 type III secretion chaperone CesT [Vibrio sp. VPAP30]OAJ92084.1 type III secretion chaperone CesT [Vibrio bivalvicida]